MVSYYLLFFFIALISSLLLGYPLIKLFDNLSAKQTIREDGPKHHLKEKAQVPTFGGLIFLIPVILITIVLLLTKKQFQTLDILVILVTMLTLGILGFIDDYLKVIKKHNKGISGWTKLFIQLLVSSIIFIIYKEDAPIIYLIWIFFIIAGASNSYNLTDGLDGLVASISILSFLGFAFLFSNLNKPEIVSFLIIFIGTLLAFLYFNKHPAKVFMGDTGSLAIGGAVGSLAVISRQELYLIFFATIPILEALSVILQVLSCQLSKKFLGVDKRIFKMAPLHHHFELSGWKETDIVKRFFAFQLVCVVIGMFVMSLRAP